MKKTSAVVGAIAGAAVAAIIIKKVMDKRNPSKQTDELNHIIDTHTEVDEKLGTAIITTYGNGQIRMTLKQNIRAAVAADMDTMDVANKCIRIASDMQAKHSPNYGLELNNIPSHLKAADFPGLHGSLPGGYELTMHSHLLLAATTISDIYQMKSGKHNGIRTIVLQRSITGMYKIVDMPETEAEQAEND